MDKYTVMFYGQSLLLAGVAAGLKLEPEFDVFQVSDWEEASRILAAHNPGVLIFDLGKYNHTDILSLLLKAPQPLLIGLDTESNQALLLSGEESHELTLKALKEIIETKGNVNTPFSDGEGNK